MADYEFVDAIPPLGAGVPVDVKEYLWALFDRFKDHRFKLKWGIFRPSFKLAILEPLFVRLIGPRPSVPAPADSAPSPT